MLCAQYDRKDDLMQLETYIYEGKQLHHQLSVKNLLWQYSMMRAVLTAFRATKPE